MDETLIILFVALIIDRLVGDPDWLWQRVPHPVVWFGKAIGWADTRFNDASASDTDRVVRRCTSVMMPQKRCCGRCSRPR